MTEQSTIPGLFCFFIAFVSMDARRVELDCAGPPHWRGSPLFGSQCRLSRGCPYRKVYLRPKLKLKSVGLSE